LSPALTIVPAIIGNDAAISLGGGFEQQVINDRLVLIGVSTPETSCIGGPE